MHTKGEAPLEITIGTVYADGEVHARLGNANLAMCKATPFTDTSNAQFVRGAEHNCRTCEVLTGRLLAAGELIE